MPRWADETVELSSPGGRLWEDVPLPSARSAQRADLLPVYARGATPRPGAVYRDGLDVDLHWHFHEMHKLLYAFEGAIEVESTRGRNVIPRQLAAWIPAGVPHCTSIHGIRWVSVFFPAGMLEDRERPRAHRDSVAADARDDEGGDALAGQRTRFPCARGVLRGHGQAVRRVDNAGGEPVFCPRARMRAWLEYSPTRPGTWN